MQSNRTAPRQILGLDLVRFACALLVVAFHYGYAGWRADTPLLRIMHVKPFLTPAWPATWFGWVAVEIFFVISGFVIAYSAKGSTAFKFSRDRLVRLGPALWICATLSLGVYLAFHLLDMQGAIRWFIKEIVFYPFPPWLDLIVWTLGIEIAFYSWVFALLCFARFQWISRLAAVLALVSLAYHLTKLGMHCDPAAADPFCSMLRANYRIACLLLLEHGSFFALGIFIWLWLLERMPLRQLWWAPAALIACLLHILNIAATAHYEEILRGEHVYLASYMPLLVWCVGVLAIVAAVRFNEAIFRQLGERSRRAIRLIGLSTYPLYLVHWTSGAVFAWLLIQSGVAFHWGMLGATVCVIILSFVIAAFLEPPLQWALRSAINRIATTAEANWSRTSAAFRSLLGA